MQFLTCVFMQPEDEEHLGARWELAFAEGGAEARREWEAERLTLVVHVDQLQAEVHWHTHVT